MLKEIFQDYINLLKSIDLKVVSMKLFMIACACALIIISVCGACSIINDWTGLKDDNVIEEAIEDVIEHQTGIDIDLTPLTP